MEHKKSYAGVRAGDTTNSQLRSMEMGDDPSDSRSTREIIKIRKDIKIEPKNRSSQNTNRKNGERETKRILDLKRGKIGAASAGEIRIRRKN